MKQLCLPALAWLAVLPLTACEHEAPPQTATPKHQVVETVVVHRSQAAPTLVLPARVMANPTAMVHIYPMISGRVLSLSILPGQQVRKGEKIGALQSSDAAQARSDYEKAKIEAARADLQLARAKELLAHEVMAQRDYDDLQALDQADHSELDRARQTLHLLGFTENDTSDVVPIVAPISGTVLDVDTGPGEMQRSLDNATAIATIADIGSVWIAGDLYPRDQAAVRLGQPADITVNGYPGTVLHGKVDDVSGAVDPVTFTLKVRVVLPNPHERLKPGMYANMTITGAPRDVMAVPATAVIRDGTSVYVFVETAPDKYQRRDVTLGETRADNDEVLQGLSDGDRVVVTGTELVRDIEGR